MESLSDIVAEMRTRSREVKEAFGGRPDGVENMLDIWADRIEAAAKRVVVSKTETTTVGNAAATREALEAAHQFVYTACRQNIDVMVKDKHGERVVKSKDVLYKIYSALSAPARNCDLYNDVEDSWQDYKQFRRQTGEDIYFDMVHFWPFAKWLLAPAAERKGEN